MSSRSTLFEPIALSNLRRLKRARTGRRTMLGALGIFLALGLTNQFGVTSRVVSDESDGYTIRVTYAGVTRLGLATPWQLEVTRPGGFDTPITIETTAAYFEIFDANSLHPPPSSATASMIVWELDPPEGDSLVISLDARIEPTYHGSRTATTSLRVAGRDVAAVTYRTRVMP